MSTSGSIQQPGTMEEFDRRRKRSCCSSRICCFVLSPSCFLFACLSLSAALIIYFLFPPFLSSFAVKQTKEKVTILPGHSTYDQLHNPGLPIYFDAYFFNLTNPKEFSEGKEPPKVEEVGPYSFREYRVKYFNKSSFSDNNTNLTYTQLKTFHFDEHHSANGVAQDDKICTINLAMVGAVAQVLAMDSGLIRDGAIELMKYIFSSTKAKLYICQPAVNLLFNYTDPLVHELHTNELLKFKKMNLPTDYISIQVNASEADSLPSIIKTGVGNIDELAEFYQWNNQTKLDIWFDDFANKIQGSTEGLFFKPDIDEGESLEVFVDNTYRVFPLIRTGKKKIKGLETFQYELPDYVFQNAFVNHSNSRWGSWCPDGMFYIGVTQKPTVPAFASKPRFMDVDPKDTSDKVHMPPIDRAKHETFLYVHPLIGSTLQFQRSLQINLQVNYTTHFSQLEHINGTTYFPIFYLTEHSELTDSFKQYIMKQGLQEIVIAKDTSYGVIGLFCLLVVVGLLCTVCGLYKGTRNRRRDGYTPIQNSD